MSVLKDLDDLTKMSPEEGVAMMKRHLKKSDKHPQGAIVELEGSVHTSNLMLQSVFDASKRKKATA